MISERNIYNNFFFTISLITLLVLVVSCNITKHSSNDNNVAINWELKEVTLKQSDIVNELQKLPKDYLIYRLDEQNLSAFFENLKSNPNSKMNVPINGQTEHFTLSNAKTMSLELAARFPNIKSYKGISKDATANIDYNQDKLRLKINYADAIFMVEPFDTKDNKRYYLIYNYKDSGYEKIPFE